MKDYKGFKIKRESFGLRYKYFASKDDVSITDTHHNADIVKQEIDKIIKELQWKSR